MKPAHSSNPVLGPIRSREGGYACALIRILLDTGPVFVAEAAAPGRSFSFSHAQREHTTASHAAVSAVEGARHQCTGTGRLRRRLDAGSHTREPSTGFVAVHRPHEGFGPRCGVHVGVPAAGASVLNCGAPAAAIYSPHDAGDDPAKAAPSVVSFAFHANQHGAGDGPYPSEGVPEAARSPHA